nr:MAG TPA: hypothetical protein [Bacteriophage sp.]
MSSFLVVDVRLSKSFFKALILSSALLSIFSSKIVWQLLNFPNN